MNRFVFFGTPDIAVASLDALFAAGMAPSLVVAAPDKPQGRGLEVAPPPTKVWADAHGVPAIQPTTLRTDDIVERLRAEDADLFVVVAYGKIIPKAVLDLPRHGAINVHPSVLPRHRGPSPIESQILTEKEWSDVGVTIMKLDEEVDHGPILAQRARLPELKGAWPMRASALRPILARHGGELLVEAIRNGAFEGTPQEHDKATFCKKIVKEDALIDLSDDPATNYRKILAYDVWPRAYFFAERNGANVRVVITDAAYENGALVLKRVVPEGKKEMSYDEFLRGNR